jgi:hypothetical protein
MRPPQYFDASTPVDYQPSHAAASSKATVLYSNGKEVVDATGAKGKKHKAADGHLLTYEPGCEWVVGITGQPEVGRGSLGILPCAILRDF